jgi:acetate kinase
VGSEVAVLVVPTNELCEIARQVMELLRSGA